jgi:PIN domain nuclease of toxin-antitoxin system
VKRSTWLLRRFGMRSLPITHAHSLTLGELPLVHNDSFDRMLVAQAKNEGMVVMTTDAVLEIISSKFCGAGK